MAIDGNKIKHLRKNAGLTQEALGKKLGVVKQTVSSWENNVSEPNNDMLLNIASIFDVPVDSLIGYTNSSYRIEELWYSESNNRLGNLLMSYRKKENISQESLSKKLNISIDTYVNLEIGKFSPSIPLLKKISAETGYDINFLIGAVDHTTIQSNVEFEERVIPISYSESNSTFRSRFEKFCSRENITHNNCEEKLSLSCQDFIDLKFNRMPTLSELLKLSYAFNVSMDYLVGRTDTEFISLSSDELELLLNYRDCSENSYRENIRNRAKDLSIASLNNSSVAADDSLKKTGTDNLGK